jgi:anti-anti-sigma factor
VSFAEDRSLTDPECWISLRTAEADHCAVSIAGSLTADAARLVRRWVVLLRDAAQGEVALHCEDLHQMDRTGAALLRELIWGLEAQGRPVEIVALSPPLERMFASLADSRASSTRCTDRGVSRSRPPGTGGT